MKIAGFVLIATLFALVAMTTNASGKRANNTAKTDNSPATMELEPVSQAVPQGVPSDTLIDTTNGSATITTEQPDATNTATSNVSVTIDDQTVAVPGNSTVQRTTTSPDGTTTVTATTSQGAASNHSYSNTRLNVYTHSSERSSETGGSSPR